MSMLYARCKHSWLDMCASTLCSEGVITGEFVCLSCEKPVTLVRPTYAVPHFRHTPGNSCVVSARESAERSEVAKARVKNRMSVFHSTWQSRFPKECLEIRHTNVVGEGVPVGIAGHTVRHVADVSLGGRLVIEIQHSQITPRDILSREHVYPSVCWIFDCTDVKFKLDDTKIKSRVTTEMVLSHSSPPLHSGVKALIIACQEGMLKGVAGGSHGGRKPTIYIDTGHTEIYLVVDPANVELNRQRLRVGRVNRARFLQDLAAEFSVEVAALWPHNTPPSPTGPVLDWDVVGVKVPYGVLVKHGSVTYKIFNPFAQWKIYARRMIDRYVTGTLWFGRHRNVPFCALPSSYRTFLLENVKNLDMGARIALEKLALLEHVLTMPDDNPPPEFRVLNAFNAASSNRTF